MRPICAAYREEAITALQYPEPQDVGLGSWPCENAGALRTRRTIFLSCAMFARPVVRRLGTCSAGRTRFPSVDVISGFSHGQGQLLPFAPSLRDLKSLSAIPQIPAMPRIDSRNGASCQKRPQAGAARYVYRANYSITSSARDRKD